MPDTDLEIGLQVSEPRDRAKLSRRVSADDAPSVDTDSTAPSSSIEGSLRSSLSQKFTSVRRTSVESIRSTLANATNRSFGGPSYDFLSKDRKGGTDKSSIQGKAKWWHGVFVFSVASLVACLVTLWAPYPIGARVPSEQVAQTPWSDGCQDGLASCICPRETCCADDMTSMIFLTIARSSAFFDYPLYILLFLSKAKNVNNYLQTTMLRCWINFSDFHRVHALFGTVVGIEATSHSFFHLLRWARRRDDIKLLWTSQTGITGLVALIMLPILVLPMAVPYLKNKLSFEWRKGLHYLSVVWGAALMFHAPSRIFYLIGVPLLIYIADRIFGTLFKTYLVENAHFERLGDSSCLVTFENPRGSTFGQQNSSYAYLMLPWLSKNQFHAFSVYPSQRKGHSQICISKAGGWTGELMSEISVPAHKPAFVAGPFLSPFNSPAMDRENLIAVASGIGITPIVSLMKQYLHTQRCINLVWICRDPGLLEWFLQNLEFGHNGFFLVYYTGKRSLVLEKDLPTNVLLYQGRPNLEQTISEIVTCIASGKGVPGGGDGVKCLPNTKTPPQIRAKALLEKAMSIYTPDQLFEYALEVTKAQDRELGLEPLDDDVDFEGVLSLMTQLLGAKAITGVILENFGLFSSDARMNRAGFDDFMVSMLEELDSEDEDDARVSLSDSRQRWMVEAKDVNTLLGSKHLLLPPSTEESCVKSYLSGDGKHSAKHWCMLYCGGSEAVLGQLKQCKWEFGIPLSVEKFDW
ncbi:hypothetical protein ACHAXT_010555 [Thalassiosira profunda]